VAKAKTPKPKKISLLERSNTPEDPSTASPERDLCQRCGLFKQTPTPFMNPPPSPGWTGKIMALGEAPDATTGRASKLLRDFLQAAKFLVGGGSTPTDETVWDAVRCRPRKNTTPSMEQVRCCRPYFLHKVDALKPQVILVMGTTAAKCVTNDGGASVVSLRGRPVEVNRG
jgi:DNA polymerase